MTLADTDKPRRNDMTSAVVSLIPEPAILTGSAIENNIIGAKTKKLIKSMFKFNEYAQIIYVVM